MAVAVAGRAASRRVGDARRDQRSGRARLAGRGSRRPGRGRSASPAPPQLEPQPRPEQCAAAPRRPQLRSRRRSRGPRRGTPVAWSSPESRDDVDRGRRRGWPSCAARSGVAPRVARRVSPPKLTSGLVGAAPGVRRVHTATARPRAPATRQDARRCSWGAPAGSHDAPRRAAARRGGRSTRPRRDPRGSATHSQRGSSRRSERDREDPPQTRVRTRSTGRRRVRVSMRACHDEGRRARRHTSRPSQPSSPSASMQSS